MDILLSKTIPKSAMIVAKTEEDVKTLRILFNNHLIRYAFVFWRKKEGDLKLPKGYEYLEVHNPLAFVTIHNADKIEDMTKSERHSRFLEGIKESKKSSPADEISFFLDEDGGTSEH